MKYLYKLEHSHIVDNDYGDPIFDRKVIGYYSSYQKALETEKRYKLITGFKEYPKGFSIEKIKIDYDDFDFE